jgi:hypothetical protein
MEHGDADQAAAAGEAKARRQLLDAGAASLPRPPWRHARQPPAAADLIQFALWRASTGDIGEETLFAALALLPAARAEIDQIEAAMLLTARSAGLSWPQISRALGLGSAQGAQQRFDRVAGRVERHDGP